MSVWTDDFCYPTECGARGLVGRPPANASCLYARALDDAFERSVGGITWPRGLVAAGALYRHDAALDPASARFTGRIHALNDQLRARGAVACPSGARASRRAACSTPACRRRRGRQQLLGSVMRMHLLHRAFCSSPPKLSVRPNQ